MGVEADHVALGKHLIVVAPINSALELGVYVTVAPILRPPLVDVLPQDIRS